jgi:hypothetical protein
MIKNHKYYVYLDETGKDINSSIFLVSVLILGEERYNETVAKGFSPLLFIFQVKTGVMGP